MRDQAGRGYNFPLAGQYVLDKESDGGESLAVAVEIHAHTPAKERYIGPIGKSVADANRDYPDDAPVVSVAFVEDLDDTIYDWQDIPTEELVDVIRSNNMTIYDYPAPRLEPVAKKAVADDSSSNRKDGQSMNEPTTDNEERHMNQNEHSFGGEKRKYDLSAVPRDLPMDGSKDEDYVRRRGEYLRRVTGFREPIPKALAYREIGYSHSGIARELDTTESTVEKWMEEITEEYGKEAIETRPQTNPNPVLE